MPAIPGGSWSTRASPPKARRSTSSRPSSRSPGRSCCVQGIVEIIRCVLCLKEGQVALARQKDVEEVDVEKLKEQLHVKDEDIAKLDEIVTARKRERQMKKEAWFGLSMMALVVIGLFWAMPSREHSDQRPPGPPDAGADRHGDHARLSHRVHADGAGNDVHLVRLLQHRPVDGGGAHARPDGAAGLLGHEQRRADLDPPVRLHGVPGRARQPDRAAVQEPAPGDLPHPRIAGRRDGRHLRDLRRRFRASSARW